MIPSEEEDHIRSKRSVTKTIRRRKNYDIPREPGEGIRSDTVYKYVGKPYRWWWQLIYPVRGRFIVAFILTGISMSLSTAVSAVIGMFVDNVYEGKDLTLILPYCLMIVGIPVFRSLVGLSYRGIYENTSQNLMMRLRQGLYRHLQGLDQPFYDRNSVGDIMARMTGDLDMVRHFTSYVLMAIFEQIMLFTMGMILMFSINWVLTLATLALSPLIVILANKFRKEVRPVWDQVRKGFSSLNSVVQQNIGGNRVVKAFVRKEHEVDGFEYKNEEYRKVSLKSVSVWLKYIPALDGISNFLAVPVILLGGIFVIKGSMTIGGLVAFNGILFVVSTPMRMLGGLMNEIQRYAASADKIIEMLNTRSRVKNPEIPVVANDPENDTVIEFSDVCFRYPTERTISTGNKTEKTVLKNISFRITKGQKIGIVGATGSGKTTIINLIARFYDVSSGKLKIYGHDIREFDIHDLRRKIGIVMQDVFLFSDTVEGNVAYGRLDAPFDEVRRMAEIAAADKFISSMPEGYETIVGERGVGLSGGQRQRISLARALCFDPEILILDDTTSAIDMETEFEIQKNLDRFQRDKTVITIAHRISSVRNCDLILVIDKGRIVEQGTHEELVALGGTYHEVYLTQSGIAFDRSGISEERR